MGDEAGAGRLAYGPWHGLGSIERNVSTHLRRPCAGPCALQCDRSPDLLRGRVSLMPGGRPRRLVTAQRSHAVSIESTPDAHATGTVQCALGRGPRGQGPRARRALVRP